MENCSTREERYFCLPALSFNATPSASSLLGSADLITIAGSPTIMTTIVLLATGWEHNAVTLRKA
jgi:hypothetical protein